MTATGYEDLKFDRFIGVENICGRHVAVFKHTTPQARYDFRIRKPSDPMIETTYRLDKNSLMVSIENLINGQYPNYIQEVQERRRALICVQDADLGMDKTTTSTAGYARCY